MEARNSANPQTKDPETTPGGEWSLLAPWFHNLRLPGGVQTAPGHPLGDYPAEAWSRVRAHLPEDLSGWRVLDAACNAGYFCFELARMGAQVVGCDRDPHCVRQAQWAADQLGLGEQTHFRQMHVYELGRTSRCYDLVLFMGAFYPVRYPVLALDILAERAEQMLIYQPARLQPDAPAAAHHAAGDSALINPALLARADFQLNTHAPGDIFVCERVTPAGAVAPREPARPELTELAAALGPRYQRIHRGRSAADAFGPN